jgi:hypothetical protein
LGCPAICKINLVLKLKNENIIKGRDVKRCIIKKCGFLFFIKENNGGKEKKKIIK